jgi:hypothetical protein
MPVFVASDICPASEARVALASLVDEFGEKYPDAVLITIEHQVCALPTPKAATGKDCEVLVSMLIAFRPKE